MTQEPTPANDAEPQASATPNDASESSQPVADLPETPATAATPETPTTVSTEASAASTIAPATAVATAERVTASPSATKASLPPWLPYFLVMALPTLVVGIAVYLLAGGDNAGGGGAGANAAAVIDGFIRLGPSSDGDVTSYKGELAPDFPKEFPLYKGMKPVASFVIPSEDEGTSYFVVFSAAGSADEIYRFYLETMDKDPWQVEVARSSDEFTGVRFSRPDNPDIQGDVTINRSELGNETVIYVSFEDVTKKAADSQAKPFVQGLKRPLPPGFPNDIPIYKGKAAESIITDTYFERRQGGRSFIVSFLTKDSQADVVNFYKGEFEKRGWTVTNSESSSSRFAISIDFSDGSKQQISGSVRADTFDDDDSYTEVSLLLQVSGSRPRGN